MYSKEITIQNETGLHARPASDFVAMAGKFKSKIQLKKADEDGLYNAKSIIMLLSMGLAKGDTVSIIAEGEDEVEAVDKLAELILSFTE